MKASRVGDVLLGIGAAVGVVAVVGLVIGFEPSKLPPALLNIAAYKLTFVAAAGLLAAGAIVRRRTRAPESGARRDTLTEPSANNALRSENAASAFDPGRVRERSSDER